MQEHGDNQSINQQPIGGRFNVLRIVAITFVTAALLGAITVATTRWHEIRYVNDTYHFELRYPDYFTKDLYDDGENGHGLGLNSPRGSMGFTVEKSNGTDLDTYIRERITNTYPFTRQHQKFTHITGELIR